MNNDDRLRRAFDNVYDHYGMFASFLMDWTKVWTRQVPYAATDGPTLYLNPDFMDTLNIAETIKVIKHEAGHVFLGHMYRVPLSTIENEQERYDWNIGMDLALNDTIGKHDPDFAMQTGDKLAEILIFPGKGHKIAAWDKEFRSMPMGKDAEFYHDLVKKASERQPKPQPQPGQGEGKDGQQSGAGQGNAPTDSQQGRNPSQGDGGSPTPSTTKGKPTTSGSGKESGKDSEAGNQPSGAEGIGNGDIPNYSDEAKRTDRPSSFGDVLPHPILESGDKELIEAAVEEWKERVAQGINNARMQGDLPGWMEELAQSLYGEQSKQNWRAILRRFMTKVVSHGGQTYDKPHRRLGYMTQQTGLIMPANRSRQASKGCILVDTSGSMSAEQCNLALSEIEGILRYFPRCEVDMVMADTRLIKNSKQTFRRSDFPLRLPTKWLGRGGTDLCAPILGVADDRSYKWLVVISDMEWSAAQATNPKIPTIFVWTPRGTANKEPYAKATFGTFIGPVEVTSKHK